MWEGELRSSSCVLVVSSRVCGCGWLRWDFSAGVFSLAFVFSTVRRERVYLVVGGLDLWGVCVFVLMLGSRLFRSCVYGVRVG